MYANQNNCFNYKKKKVVHGVKFVLVSVDMCITFEIVYNTHVTINK